MNNYLLFKKDNNIEIEKKEINIPELNKEGDDDKNNCIEKSLSNATKKERKKIIL